MFGLIKSDRNFNKYYWIKLGKELVITSQRLKEAVFLILSLNY